MSRKILKLAPERSHYFRLTHRGAGNRQRSGLLERLLARADEVIPVTDWRADAFRVIAEPSTSMPAVGAAALYADRGPVDAMSAFIATPVHYVAEMSDVRLSAGGMLSLQACEAEALAVDFNRVWNDAGIRMLTGRCAKLFCLFDRPLKVATHDPEELLDRYIADYLPTGAAGPRLRQLMSEIEMWLFEHDVNQARIAAAADSVSGLWLWGGGPALRSLPRLHGWTAGNDPLFEALAGGGDVSPNVTDRTASGVVVVAEEPGTEAWRTVESLWLRRSIEELWRGRIGRLYLSTGSRCFSVRRHWHWRLWRRPRPWWESIA